MRGENGGHEQNEVDQREHHYSYDQQRCCQPVDTQPLKAIGERGQQISNCEAGYKGQQNFAEQPQHHDEQQQSLQPKEQLPLDERWVGGSTAPQTR